MKVLCCCLNKTPQRTRPSVTRFRIINQQQLEVNMTRPHIAILKKSHSGIYTAAAVIALMIAYNCSNIGAANTDEGVMQNPGLIAP
jgi:hypothetical protein